MPEGLRRYTFPARPAGGLLFGLSVARLAALAGAGVVFIVAMSAPSAASLGVGLVVIVVLLGAVAVRVAGRPVIDWLPVLAAYGWAMATRNNEFYASPDLADPLPEGVLDLPGELFGVELHSLDVSTDPTVANPTPVGYGVVRDVFRDRLVAVAEVSAGEFLFLDPDDQQGRISSWGGLLDHIAQSMPEICRLQVVHTVAGASTANLAVHHQTNGGRGNDDTASSYADVLQLCGAGSQEHRMLLAVALDLTAARRPIRQAGGGLDGAAKVLMDRAGQLEDTLAAAGVDVHGWLPARTVAHLVRTAFDPAFKAAADNRPDDVNDGGGVDPAVAGPSALVDGWSAVRHDSGWSTTLQVVRPPSRPTAGDFLAHLLVGVPATRRMSLLYVPTPMATAERRAQSQQVTTESEQTLRARFGFSTSARHRRAHADAARREQDLVSGRAVYQLVWLITVTSPTLTGLDGAVGHVETAARRCGLELRRLVGTQRQAACFTLPLCRGAR